MFPRRMASRNVGILRGLHGDLREEHHVPGQLRQPLHQLEPLGAQRAQLGQPRGVVLPFRLRQIRQRDRVEVVVGQRHETIATPPEFDDLVDDRVHAALARLLAVGAPHRAERAVLRAAANGLDRAQHVAPFGHQIPARGHELVGVDAAGLVDRLQGAARRVVEHDRPGHVAVALHHRVRAAKALRFLGVERGVNAAVDHDRAARPGLGPDLVATQGVAGVNAQADHVSGFHAVEVEGFQRLVGDSRVAIACRRRSGEHEQPTWSDDSYAERQVARVDEVDRHAAGCGGGAGYAWGESNHTFSVHEASSGISRDYRESRLTSGCCDPGPVPAPKWTTEIITVSHPVPRWPKGLTAKPSARGLRARVIFDKKGLGAEARLLESLRPHVSAGFIQLHPPVGVA